MKKSKFQALRNLIVSNIVITQTLLQLRFSFISISITFALTFILSKVNSQVVINEFCVANYSDFNPGDNEDWIEFYNTSAVNENIGGYWLSDDPANPMKWQFPANTIVNPGGRLVVLLSGAGNYDPNMFGYLNTQFRVTQTDGESIIFSSTSGSVMEAYNLSVLGSFQANHSYGRLTDGSAQMGIITTPSADAPNNPSNIFTSYAATPQLNIQAGWQSGPIEVSITASAGDQIYYTLDGSEPSDASILYTGPVAISSTAVLRAIAYSSDPDVLPSFIETNTYFFGNDIHQVMMVSISGTTLGDGQWGWGGGELTHIEFFTPQGVFIAEATGDSNEHGNDSNAYDQRGFDYITRDAMGYDNEVEFPVFSTSERPSYERLIFKAAANDNYPFSGGAHIRDAYVHKLSELGDLHLDERKVESCVLYINGTYWGVYEAREKVDDIDYTDYYYDQGDGFVDFIKTWGGTWNEYGSAADWNTLVGFITANDMTDPLNYDYVLTQYNHMSLIDYFILNGYVVSTDWLNWNTAWWRGRNPNGDARRWRYALWDNDATFGHYVNYTGVPSTEPNADPCQIDAMGDVGGQGHVPVLNALFNNESFFGDYIQRYATLSNTIFSCERMLGVLDSMIAVIDPEMQRHVQRWGGDYNSWLSQVDELRNFILARCNSTVIAGVEDCYDVTAYQVTVDIDGTGEIEFADVSLDNSNTPFSGTYFGGAQISLHAESDGLTCGNFAGWEIISGTGVIGDPSSPDTYADISSDVTLVAHFIQPNSGPVTITVSPSIAGAGAIEVNGTSQFVFPYNYNMTPGDTISLQASANPWYTFDHWESLTGEIIASASPNVVDLTSCVSDSITAVYQYTEHFLLQLELDITQPVLVIVQGDTIEQSSILFDWEAGLSYEFSAISQDPWTTFSHWEINGNSISPDSLSPQILLLLQETGTISPVFVTTPHASITVMVEPRNTGTVQFERNFFTGGNFITTDFAQSELESFMALDFMADANEYYDFSHWEVKYANPFPEDSEKNIRLRFTRSDTVIAHFKEQEFNLFIPNAFTPNNDGVNDAFLVQGNAVDTSEFKMTIYNKWGQPIFHTEDIHVAWLGDFEGNRYYCRDEIYYYLIKTKSIFSLEEKIFKGSFLVFR